MASKGGLLLTVVGVGLTFGGTVQSFASMGELTAVLAWALVALLGVFTAVGGAKRALSGPDDGESANAEMALGKVDSRFGPR